MLPVPAVGPWVTLKHSCHAVIDQCPLAHQGCWSGAANTTVHADSMCAATWALLGQSLHCVPHVPGVWTVWQA